MRAPLGLRGFVPFDLAIHLEGWVIYERKAFRQNPSWLFSVFNFFRRALGRAWSLKWLSRVLALDSYDDHPGFSREEFVEEECHCVLEFCGLLGVETNTETQHGSVLNILGITFNFGEARLYLLETRRTAWTFEIVGILSRGSLCSGEAAKFQGNVFDVCLATCRDATGGHSC